MEPFHYCKEIREEENVEGGVEGGRRVKFRKYFLEGVKKILSIL